MLDTIQCSIVTPVEYLTGEWIPHTEGIEENRFADTKYPKYKIYWSRLYNGIIFHYFPHRFKEMTDEKGRKKRTWQPLLWMSFSAATMQNGVNVIPYNFAEAKFAVEEIERTIYEATNAHIKLQDIKTFSRIDINKNVQYRGDKQRQALMDFFGKIYCDGSQDKTEYDTGYMYGNDSVKFRFYLKDEDANLGKELLKYMPPTARLEFQLHKYRIDKYYPEGISLYTLLTNELYTARVWNNMLDEYRIGGNICHNKTLYKRAAKIFNNTKRIKARKLRQLRQVNDVTDNTKHRDRTIAQTKSVVKELDDVGICPYSCEMHIELKEDILKILLKKKTVTGSFWHGFLLLFVKSVVYTKEHIDSS